MTHAFILEFASAEERDYYLLKDRVHHAFSAKAAPLIEDSVVVDLEDGKPFADATPPSSGMPHTGSCPCSALSFEVPLSSPKHILCHRRTCPLLGGGPYSLNAIVPLYSLRVTKGQPKAYIYTGASGRQVLCYHCSNFTSHVYHVQMVSPERAIAKIGMGGEIFVERADIWG